MATYRTIAAYRNDASGTIQTPHLIGHTDAGRPIYQAVPGWSPVDASGHTERVDCDRDGNWMPRTGNDAATYAIVITRQWYGPKTTKERHLDPATYREWRGTRSQARAEIERLERGTYECAHNESGAPGYSIVRDDTAPRQ